MALLKQTMRKAPHTNILQENLQTFIIHDILSSQSQQQQQIISNDNANAIIIDPTTSNSSSTATSTPIYELGKHLLNAAKTGNINEIKSLMGRGAAFTPDWLGACPLHYAASNGHVQACEVLLKAGISRNSRTKVDRTPLHMAVYEGHIDVVENLIKHGADINAKDMLQMTPLQWAVQRCNNNNDNGSRIAMVKCLLDNKAKVRAENKFGNTALDIARQLENIELIELIKNVMAEVGEDDLLANDDDTKDDEIVVDQQQEHCAVDADEPAAMADRQPYYVDQEEVNEYLNDVVRLSSSSADQQQQVVTIEDCIDAAEDATNIKATVLAPLLIDNGYCSSTSVDQQAQQPLVDQQHIDLTNDESTSGTIIEQQNNDAVVDDPYRLLRQRYGIELLPELEEDGGRILKQAMDSGHSVSLTEAGKRALKAIKLQVQVQEDPPPSNQEDEHVDQQQQQQQQLFLSATNGKQLKKQAPLQLINKGIVQQQKQTIGHKLGGNIVNTSKRKRILPYSVTSASNLNKKIVILQNTNSQNTTTVQVAPAMIGTARQLHELVNTTAPSSGVGNMLIRQGSKQLVRQQKQWQQVVVGQQQQQQKQQETTLVTLTADEFAGLQANGGLITTNNGIYRIMDYNNTPVTSVTGVKYKKSRNNSNTIVGQTGVIVQQQQQQQQQQESDTIKSLKQQLQEQRHLVDIYKRKYLKKEAEAERFKQQLKLMLKDRSSNKDLNSDAIYNNNNNNNGNER